MSTADITTEAGNISHVDLVSLISDMLAGVGPVEGMRADAELVAAKLAGQSFRSMSDLDAAISEIIENDADVFVRAIDGDLHDSDTAELIGPATDEQIAASLAAGETGHILIDADGDVIDAGTWDGTGTGVRKVYVA